MGTSGNDENGGVIKILATVLINCHHQLCPVISGIPAIGMAKGKPFDGACRWDEGNGCHVEKKVYHDRNGYRLHSRRVCTYAARC